ncbi:MAG: efflux RND transporter periplasmic adaptor subunit [Cyclobacteriaceae bacterium]|nr:efflux RND transporter periplasmic adaptor subunit [Cyclobacteriaceae bacterium]
MRFLRFSFALLLAVSCSRNSDFVNPVTKPLLEAVYASGTVVSESEYQAFSQVDGYIAAKLVKDGDAVKKGDPLYIIEADQQSARYRIARENYALAKQNFSDDSPVLMELKASLKTAQTKMQHDSVNLVRFTNLITKQATTQAEYDRAKLVFEQSKNDYLLMLSRYRKMHSQLQAELINAENQYRIARDESDRYTIRSQVDGVVFKTMKEQGELIRRTEAVAVLGSDKTFYLQLNVDELDIHRVKVNQQVLVKIDAYPQHIFKAEVMRIYPLVDSRQQSLRVDAKLLEALPGMFSGLALEANIVIRQTEQALVIPKSALLPGDSVIIRSGSGEKKIRIIRGASTLDEVEVVDGLTASSELKIKP